MKVVQIRTENVMGCKLAAVRLDDKSVTIIGGDNGQGKSSFINSLLFALCGKKALPPEPIADGEDEALVSVHLSGQEDTLLPWPCTVERRIERDARGGVTSKLTITADDGSEPPSPQTILDSLWKAGLGLDPIAAAKKDPRELVEILKSMVGLDFSELDKSREKLYAERTRVNKEVKNLEGAIAKMPFDPDAPSERVVVSKLVELIEQANAHNQRQVELERTRSRLLDDAANVQKQIEQLQQRLKAIEEQYAATEEPQDSVDTTQLKKELESAEETNNKVAQNEKRLERMEAKAKVKRESKQLTKQIEDIDKQKAKQAREAEWPVTGLEFTHSGLTYLGHPIEQLSFTERVHLTIGLQFALNKDFPFVIVWEGANLLDKAVKDVARIASEHGGQVLMERPTTDPQECHVIFEEGIGRTAEAVA